MCEAPGTLHAEAIVFVCLLICLLAGWLFVCLLICLLSGWLSGSFAARDARGTMCRRSNIDNKEVLLLPSESAPAHTCLFLDLLTFLLVCLFVGRLFFFLYFNFMYNSLADNLTNADLFGFQFPMFWVLRQGSGIPRRCGAGQQLFI